jgi:serine/threonine protein kinase
MFYFDEDHTEHGFNAPTSNNPGCPQREIINQDRTATGIANIATIGCFFDRGSTTAQPASSVFHPSYSEATLPVIWPKDLCETTRYSNQVDEMKTMNENFNGLLSHGFCLKNTGSDVENENQDKDKLSTGRFILGDDEEEFLSDESDFDSATAGFPLDEDSGIGFSAPNSVSDENELMEQPTELIPLRSINIGSLGRPSVKTRRRASKLRFQDLYKLTDHHLGSGAYASVRTAVSVSTGQEVAVKLVHKHEPGHTRSRIMREVDTFNLCKQHPNIVQLLDWFEDADNFYLVFEKMHGGPLLNHIQRKICFTEQEASQVAKDIVTGLKFLHDHGIAHRDIKPENILCTDPDRVSPVKLCDLDLASKPQLTTPRSLPSVNSEPNLASPVGSAEFMAPEVVDAFVGDALKYDKRCDMWSVGVIIYIMLCGYPPFYGECSRDDCEWNNGLPCEDCQNELFHRIQRGKFEFPEDEWKNISSEATDLISRLLVKNVKRRLTANEVLKHPWIRSAPNTKLSTPNNLVKTNSARDVHQINEHFQIMNRFGTRLSSRSENTDESGSPPSPTTLEVPETFLNSSELHNRGNKDMDFHPSAAAATTTTRVTNCEQSFPRILSPSSCIVSSMNSNN